MWRDVFLFSCNPEVYLDVDNIRSLLPEIGNGASKLTRNWRHCASLARVARRVGPQCFQALKQTFIRKS